MTFEDLRKFATNRNIENDQYGVYLYSYTLYPSGEIWMNRRSYLSGELEITVKIAEDRTPRQQYHFISALL